MENINIRGQSKKLGIRFNKNSHEKKDFYNLRESNYIEKDTEIYVFGDNIDELISELERLNNGIFVNEFVCEFPNLTEEQFIRLDLLMVRSGNAEEMVKYAEKRGELLSNRDEFEIELVNLKESKYITQYAKNGQVNNIDIILPFIYPIEKAYIIKNIAIKNYGVDLLKLKKAIFQTINVKEQYINFWSVYHNKLDDIPEEIKQTVMDDPEFQTKIRNKYVVKELSDFCFLCQDKSKDILTQEDIEKLEQLLIETKNVICMGNCTYYIKGINKERLQREIEKSGDAQKILFFARYVEGADISKLRIAMIKTRNIKYNILFMKEFGIGRSCF